MAKELMAALQGEVLGPEESDCGTQGAISILLTGKNYRDFRYQYIKTNKGLVLLDDDTKDLFIGKEVKFRSPMYCTGVKSNNNICLCSKCAGSYFYMLGKPNIGLVASKVSTTITQLNLQKFHQNLVKTHQLDVKDLLI